MLANELEDNGLRESPTMHGAAYASARAPRFAGDDLDHDLRMAAQLIMENAAGHANQENVWAGGAFGGGGVGMQQCSRPARAVPPGTSIEATTPWPRTAATGPARQRGFAYVQHGEHAAAWP